MITTRLSHQRLFLLPARMLRLALACALLPALAVANQGGTPATTSKMDEAPPPWAAESAPAAAEPMASVPPAPASVQVAVEPPQAAPAAAGIENWYRNRRKSAVAPDNGVAALQAAASSGDPAAQYKLALQYRSDDNPKADIKQSLEWQQRAAQAGYAEAQYGLGLLYANGQYVTADNQQAQSWFQKAADQGHVAARLALLSLDNGASAHAVAASSQLRDAPKPPPSEKAVPRTETQNLASRPAEPVAPEPEPAERVAPVVEPASRPEPVMTAVSLTVPDNQPQDPAGATAGMDMTGIEPSAVRQSAESGDKQAQLMLGTLYEDGIGGLPSDPREAAFWYEQAAKQDYPKAQYNLGLLYEDGRGVNQNFDQAAYWYDRAAKAGFAEAQNNLGVLYVLGKGVKKDPKKAEKLFTEAASRGNGDAGRNLEMLRKG